MDISVSICMPSIRIDNLNVLYTTLLDACGELKFELIVVVEKWFQRH